VDLLGRYGINSLKDCGSCENTFITSESGTTITTKHTIGMPVKL